MELHTRVLPPEVLIPELLAVLDQAESVPLAVTGGSMTPFLAPGRDQVFLSKISRPLKRGDVILYRRDSGQYVLHRICRVRGEALSLVGDAQTIIEEGVRREQALALVTAVQRKGKLLKPGCFCWTFFEKIWIRMIPLRRLAVGAWCMLTGKGRSGA